MMMTRQTIRVLITDDSGMARGLLRAILEDEPGIEVVGEACNGSEAVTLAASLRPDLITMDLNMPVMTGMQAIEEIMHTKAVPILVVSSESDAEKAYEALRLGALEVMSKPDYSPEEAAEFVAKVRLLAGVPVITHLRRRMADFVTPVIRPVEPLATLPNYRQVFAIASSTGGPQALASLLPALGAHFPAPVLIAQHMSDGFVEGMAHWLSTLCLMPVKVAEEGEVLQPGQVYVSPSEQHLTISRSHRVVLAKRTEKDIYRPSCDALLTSVAEAYGKNAIGIIMTGMGRDGSKGMAAIHQQGGITLAQDEASSVIYGMNQEAVNAGVVDKVLPLAELAMEMQHIIDLKPEGWRASQQRGTP
ncbi:chemotaxis-specific protein-glutamate methyltransferase CheB [Marinospirillum alkaliphilum]|uniref:Protein-glutamate methylesterase/protein-glutamine glutaminase n=1 Tax=Marinospirillum alkaliphilum DSM 21637 TaxID=1122209 RepID=A0A1K1XRQ8_9GAMM|nr:chemotaxis-specific protein-glutamate methyltransferase CheB [Marinospirillum alkaliphilum]SFX52280.1 two-component system, chemotaxis family, response regulator CheB [Marinospirillum alkaliphilum DSM 21637]